MTLYLRQGTASQELPLGPFIASADGSRLTGLTIANTDIHLWKSGATSVVSKNSGGATHMANGVYYAVLDATDTDTLGSMLIDVTATGTIGVRVEVMVLPETIYDSMILGTDLLQADMTQIAGAAVSASTAQLGVNVVSIAANAITAAAIATDAIDADCLKADAVTEIQSGLATSSALSTVAGYIDTEVAAILAAVDTEVAAIKAKTDNLPASPAAVGSNMGSVASVTAAVTVGTNNDKTGYALTTAPPTAAEVSDAVWDEALSGHSGAGSAGLALATASSGGVDPSVLADAIWDEALSGHATGGTAGKALADVLVDTGTTLEDEIAAIDGIVDAIKAKTDLIPASPAAVGSAMTLTAAYDAAKTAASAANLANLDSDVAAVAVVVDIIPTLAEIEASSVLAKAANQITVDEIHDEVVEGTLTQRQATRIMLAALAGKATGGGTTAIAYRDVADTKDRISATVDSDGNRTAITRDGT